MTVAAKRTAWVLFAYKLPRNPSTPRSSLWRKLRRLGAAQLLDGLAALPLDARNREQVEWLADEVVEAGGEATIWVGELASAGQERELASRMAKGVAAEYRSLIEDAEVARKEPPGQRAPHARSASARAAADPGARLLPAAGARAGSAGGGGARRPGRGAGAMRWATRRHCHVDRAACAWLIRRFLDSEAEFVFVDDPEEVSTDATPFDMRGVELSHHGGDCSFETFLRRYELDDPVLWEIAKVVHEADLADERYDAPEAPGLDVLLRGLSMVRDDEELLALSGPLFDGLYEYRKRALLSGREPA
jgi:hypothetical protein